MPPIVLRCAMPPIHKERFKICALRVVRLLYGKTNRVMATHLFSPACPSMFSRSRNRESNSAKWAVRLSGYTRALCKSASRSTVLHVELDADNFGSFNLPVFSNSATRSRIFLALSARPCMYGTCRDYYSDFG